MGNPSKTVKRRLRRIRRANMPPVVSETKPDEPHLSKTAKRKLRNKRKAVLLAESEEYILLKSNKVGSCPAPKKGMEISVIKGENTAACDSNSTAVVCKDMLPGKTVKPKLKKIKKTTSKSTSEVVTVTVPGEMADVCGLDNRISTVATHKEEVNNVVKDSVEEQTKKPSCYVLFVGNIPYTLTREALAAHFNKTDHPPKAIRLVLQEKSKTLNKGFAYVEFASEEGYLSALKLHHSFLDRRRINVEYSTPTKGKNAKSKTFVKKKNKTKGTIQSS